MSNGQKAPAQSDPWKNEGQVFRAIAVVVLLSFGGFVAYDGRQFYARYIKRCEGAADRPECKFSNISKPKPRPDLGIVLDQAGGKWAIQLEATDEKTARENSTRLWEAGAEPRLIKINGRRKVAFYYLQLGRFKTQKEALDAGAQLRTRGLLQSFTVSGHKPATN